MKAERVSDERLAWWLKCAGQMRLPGFSYNETDYAMAELYRACMVMAEGWARGAEGYRMVLRVPEAPA